MKKRLLHATIGSLLCLGVLVTTQSCNISTAGNLDQKKISDPFSERIDSVLSLMTLEEKVGQLVQYSSYAALTGPGEKDPSTQHKHDAIKAGRVGSLLNVVSVEAAREAQELAVGHSRLGIPLIMGYDVIHGFKTMFPVPLGETASWDLEIIEKTARVAAVEAASAGIAWTFAPMVDICRDARWGRIMEGAGEDPFLGSRVAAARVKGFQGNDLSDPLTIAACTKHFAGYGFAEAGRDYNTVDVSDHTLWNVILPPFKATIDAGVVTAMCAFNDIGGVPSSANSYLLRDVLRDEWGFNGFVVSDWGSIAEMIEHGTVADRNEASLKSIDAGVDMDMEGNCYDAHLANLVAEEMVDEAVLDEAVRRVLRVKFELGLMDDPFLYINSEREVNNIYTDSHRELARDVARKSIVLLKNESGILPLSKEGGAIAVIGPLAKDKDSPLGNWRAQAITNSAVSAFEGIEDAVGAKRNILYAEGCKLSIGPRNFAEELVFNTDDRSGFDEAKRVAARAEVVVVVVGEDSQQSGEGRSQTDVGLAGLQQELLEKIYSVNKQLVVVLMNGRPLEITWAAEHAAAIVETWHLGSEAGNAIADVLFGDYNPSGKLPVCFPRAEGQLPIYYARKNTGRPGPLTEEVFWSHYTDMPNEPLYPFGFGLSYTTFEYGDIDLSAETFSYKNALTAQTVIRNTGTVAGREVVQLYIQDPVASVTRPVRELKGFQIVELKPGEERTITFEIGKELLSFYSNSGELICESGQFNIYIGTNSVDCKEAKFTLNQEDVRTEL